MPESDVIAPTAIVKATWLSTLRGAPSWGAAIGLAAIVIVAIAVLAWRRETTIAPQYSTVAVTRGTVAPAVISSGTVNPVTTIQIGSYVSGVIKAVFCDFNTRVRAGQLCAKIDPRPYQTIVEQESAALGTTHAQLIKDRANLNYARLIQQRNSELLKRGIVSQETADTSDNAYQQAKGQLALDEASVAQHKAQLKAARINLSYTDIASPVDGTVVSRNVTQGQTVAASFQTPTLFLIATDLTKMQVDTNVSESDIGRIAVGNVAHFTVASYPDRQFSGVVQQVRQAPQIVQNVVTYDVVVSVPNADRALMPGMTASMRIVTSRADNVLRIPDQALRYRPTARNTDQTQTTVSDDRSRATEASRSSDSLKAGTAHVWVLSDGRPHRITVKVGLDDDAYAEVSADGLREGDAVIVSEHATSTHHGQTTPVSLVPSGR